MSTTFIPAAGPTLVNLFPTVRPSREQLIEDAVDAIEALGSRGSFTVEDVIDATYRAPRNYGATRQAIKTLESHGLLRRISGLKGPAIHYVLAHD